MSSVLMKEYLFVRSLTQRIFGYWVLTFYIRFTTSFHSITVMGKIPRFGFNLSKIHANFSTLLP